jgi:hypothetical protein
MFNCLKNIASVLGGLHQQNASTQIVSSIASKKLNYLLAIGFKKGYFLPNQLSPALNRDGFFLKEQSICQSGILQFATLKIF